MHYTVKSWTDELVACVHFLHQRGWAPATSSNYSFRQPGETDFFISASGIDKGAFQPEHLMLVDAAGYPIDDPRRPSAETLLHALVYRRHPETACVLHTHSVFNTVLSAYALPDGGLTLAGWEVLKAIKGITTHQASYRLPVFANDQDMPALAAAIDAYWDQHGNPRAFLLAGHGLYTWGESIAAAKRQVEALEFLLECDYRLKMLYKS